MLFSKQTPAAGGTAFSQFDAAWAYDGNGYILNDTGTSLDVRIGAAGNVQTLAAGGTLPIKLVYSLAELYVRRTDQSTTQVTVEATVGTGSAGGGGSEADVSTVIRVRGGTYYAADYGQISDTLAVSHLAIQAAIDAAYAAGGGEVLLPVGLILLGGSLVPRSGVTVRGILPSAPSTNVSWDLGFYLSGGSILSFPGGIVFHQDNSGTNLDHLTEFNLDSLGFSGCQSIFVGGVHDKPGPNGMKLHNILGDNIIGDAFKFGNFQHINGSYITLRRTRRGFYFFSDGSTREVVTDGGNSYFEDIYIQQDSGATGSAIRFETFQAEHWINYVTFQNLQINRFISAGQVGSHIECVDGGGGFNFFQFLGVDLEGSAESAINMKDVSSTVITIRGITAPSMTRIFYGDSAEVDLTVFNTSANLDFLDGTSAGKVRLSGSVGRAGTSNKRPIGFYYDVSRGVVQQFGNNDWQKLTFITPYKLGFGGAVGFSFEGGTQPVFGNTAYSGNATIGLNDGPIIYLTGTGAQSINVGAPDANAAGYRRLIIKKGTGGTATLTGVAGGDVTLANQYSCAELVSDGTAWYLFNKQGT